MKNYFFEKQKIIILCFAIKNNYRSKFFWKKKEIWNNKLHSNFFLIWYNRNPINIYRNIIWYKYNIYIYINYIIYNI